MDSATDWISAIADVIMAICAIVGAVQIVRGVRAWREHFAASERIEQKKAARRLARAANELALHVGSLRKGKIPPQQSLQAKKFSSEEDFFSFHLTTIEVLIEGVWSAHREGIVFFPENTLQAIIPLARAAKDYHEAIQRYLEFKRNGTPPDEERRLKDNMIMAVPDSGEDPFDRRIQDALGNLITAISPLLKFEPE